MEPVAGFPSLPVVQDPSRAGSSDPLQACGKDLGAAGVSPGSWPPRALIPRTQVQGLSPASGHSHHSVGRGCRLDQVPPSMAAVSRPRREAGEQERLWELLSVPMTDEDCGFLSPSYVTLAEGTLRDAASGWNATPGHLQPEPRRPLRVLLEVLLAHRFTAHELLISSFSPHSLV